MTTIVANLECMAADQRMTDSGPYAHIQKIRRVRSALYGIAGDVSLAMLWFKWFDGKREPARLHTMLPEGSRHAFTILELGVEGLALWDGWGVRVPLLDSKFAIGSGALAALTAIESCNMLPADAVRAAMRRDEGSGVFAEPQVEFLQTKPIRKRRA